MPDRVKSGSVSKVARSPIRSALAWNVGGTLLRAALQFPVGIVIARQIGPHNVGVGTAALIIVGISNLFADSGLTAHLVTQAETPSKSDIDQSFTLQMEIAAALLVGIVALAPLQAHLFSDGHFAAVYALAGLIVPLQAIGASTQAILRRQFRHRLLQRIQFVSYVVGYAGTAIVLGALSLGVWAIVAGLAAQATIASLLTLGFGKVRPRLRFGGGREIWLSGRAVLGANLGNWAVENMDNVIIGSVRGPTDLGFYSRPYQLFRASTDSVVAAGQQVLFPAFARSNTRDRTNALYVRSTTLSAILLFPLLGSVAAIGGPFVVAVYGKHWASAGVTVAPLALAMMFHVFVAASGPLLWGKQRADLELRAQIVCITLMIVCLPLAARHSLELAAWTVLGVYAIRAVLCQGYAVRIGELPAREMALLVTKTASVAAVAAAVAGVLEHIVLHELFPSLNRLAGVAVAVLCGTALSYVASMAYADVRREVVPMLMRIGRQSTHMEES